MTSKLVTYTLCETNSKTACPPSKNRDEEKREEEEEEEGRKKKANGDLAIFVRGFLICLTSTGSSRPTLGQDAVSSRDQNYECGLITLALHTCIVQVHYGV